MLDDRSLSSARKRPARRPGRIGAWSVVVGDGNSDDIPDRQQGYVVSLPNAADVTYVQLLGEDEPDGGAWGN